MMNARSTHKSAPRSATLLAAIASIATCFPGPALAQADSVIQVPAGDSQALIEAFEYANELAGVTTIRLDGASDYRFDLTSASPPLIAGRIVLIGDGAKFVGDGPGSLATLFEIGQSGSLDVGDLIISDFSTPEFDQYSGFIVNEGELRIRDLRIEHFFLGNHFSGALISNGGVLEIDRLRISDIETGTISYAVGNSKTATIRNMLVANFRISDTARDPSFVALIGNSGCAATLDLQFSSLMNLEVPSPNISAIQQTNYRPYLHCQGVRMSASMVVGLGCPFGEHARSEGLNLVSAEDCTSNKASDIIGDFPNAAKLRTEPDGGVAVTLPYFSPALDRISGTRTPCPARDAIRTPRPLNSRNIRHNNCDIGAFEQPAGTPLFEGGDNGLYYSSGHDGHYVTIQEVRPEEYVIFWNTFDLDGNHTWLFAQGNRTSRNIIKANAYYQSEGILVPGAGAEVNTDALLDWGRITVTLFDCFEGRFAYDSDLPQFGSGTFRINRLGFVDALGCADPDSSG